MYNFTPSQMEEILSSYFSCEGNAAEAARCLSLSNAIVSKHWKEQGFKAQWGGKRARLDDDGAPNQLTEAEISTIVKAHEKYSGNATEAARCLHHGTSTIVRYWKLEGLLTGKKGRPSNAERSEMILKRGLPESGELLLSDAKLDRIIESFRLHDPDRSNIRDVIRQMKGYRR
jgi:hypothetical protein